MAHIRKWQDIEDRGGEDWLTEAESKLIAACKAGDYCELGEGELPPKGNPTPDRELRADVLRYLILGGCDDCPVDDIGVWASGGHVTGMLDLDFTTTKGAIRLPNSRFEQRLDCEQTQCRSLHLSGSDLKGIRAQGAKISGNVFLTNMTTHATIDLNSATIGGQLACDGAKFNVKEGKALNAQGAKISGNVFLTNMTTHATIALNSATIGGQLACTSAKFDVEEGDALDAQDVKISGGLIWRDVTISKGDLYFVNA